ncbi:MAG: hypothetical protein IKI72_07970 [Bacteroidales bacterium]|nr:hypothetical protein [Bacteroidales bacterium]
MKFIPVFLPRFLFGISELAAAGIMSGASLGAGFITSAGSKRAVRESAKYNQMMYAQQRQDYLSDREHAELYDSPAAQRRRFEEAGLNPYFMLDGSNAGTAQSPANIAGNPLQQQNVFEPIGAAVSNGASSAMSMYMQMQAAKNADAMAKEQVKGVQLDNEGKYLDNVYNQASLLSRIGFTKYQVRKAVQDYNLAEQLNPLHIQTQRQQLQNLQTEHSINQVNLTLAQLNRNEKIALSKYLEPAAQLDIVQRLLDIRTSYHNGSISKERAKQAVYDTAQSAQDWSLHKLDKGQISNLRQALYDVALSDAESRNYQNMFSYPDSGMFSRRESWFFDKKKRFEVLNPLKLGGLFNFKFGK